MRYRDYRSPRGVHVDTGFDQDLEEGHAHYAASPRRNRYSRPNQTPRISDVTWIQNSAPQHSAGPTPHTSHTQTPRISISSPQGPPPPQPLNLPTPVIGYAQASPAPTEHEIAEHMVPDDDPYGQYQDVEPYQPHPQGSGARLMKSFLKHLKRIPGLDSQRLARMGSHSAVQMPEPRFSFQSSPLGYGDPPPPAMEPQRVSTPYTSPYVPPATVSGTPAVTPASLHVPSPRRSSGMPPPITVSPSLTPPAPLPGSVTTPSFVASPVVGGPQSLHPDQPVQEDDIQTLNDPAHYAAPVYPELPPQPIFVQIPPPEQQEPSYGARVEFPSPIDSPSRGSLSSTVARFRRFVAGLDQLPWVSEDQIADQYLPSQTSRSKLRAQLRNHSDPSWYNDPPEPIRKPMYWQTEWDLFAKRSTAMMLNGNALRWGPGDPGLSVSGHEHGHGGVRYPHGYAPTQPVFVYPSGFPPPGQFAAPMPV
ncbi:hypothetical protein PAXRUDRAFT_833404 [Paxillus rubicundulus Ve08.2h10]|uniref:Uncharacterized protein n=1 Tax=Paxillus rubicundulus Ve08.2h10 TaxID=930991 RepID=A0A0D0CYD0_9AGAM|nr:hypothetical protein PAXRUDRAFT_833404 [Paxillus rubicundulus Ve08.2h10]